MPIYFVVFHCAPLCLAYMRALRIVPDEHIATLAEPTRDAIRRRLGR